MHNVLFFTFYDKNLPMNYEHFHILPNNAFIFIEVNFMALS